MILQDCLSWVLAIYQTEGLGGLVATLLVGGLLFGGMGAIFWLAAGASAKSIKENNDKKDS